MAPFIWLAILAFLILGFWKLIRLRRPPWRRLLFVGGYLWVIWTIVTRV